MVLLVKVLIILLIILLGACGIATYRSDNEQKKTLMALFCVGAFSMIMYATFISSITKTAAVLLDGLFFASIDWMLFILVIFALDYTKVHKRNRMEFVLNASICTFDSVMLVGNVFFNNVFSIKSAINVTTGEFFWVAIFEWPYYIHLAYCYILVAWIVLAFVNKVITAPRMYRGAYSSIAILFAVLIISNLICFSMKLPIDVSVLMYSGFAAVICYFVLYSSPKALVNKMLIEVNSKIKDGTVCYDYNNVRVYHNQIIYDLFIDAANDDIDENRKNIERAMSAINPMECDYYKDNKIVLKLEGEEHYFVGEIISLYDQNEKIGYMLKLTDNTSEIKAYEREYCRATYDSLTGIYNRERFFEEAQRVLREDPDTPRYLITSDIKDFKLINELFGQKLGDEVLKEQASLIRKLSHKGNVYGRIADNRFALLMPCKYFSEDKFNNAMKSMQLLTDESVYKMHVYVGIYKITDPAEDVQSMYNKAMLTIESVKGDYRRVYVYYDERIMRKLVYENNVLSEFQEARNNHQFRLYLQPQYNADGKVIGAEAFPCWHHPNRGLLKPDKFYSILEKTGHVYMLDTFIWEMAVKQLAKWSKLGRDDLFIAVNVSSNDYYYLDIYNVFIGYLKKYGVDSKRLKVEITETALMRNIDMFMELFNNLRNHGIDLEIDSFGNGYSSLNMLKDINAECIKLDTRFFIESDIDKEEERAEKKKDKDFLMKRSKIIFKSIFDMAMQLGMKVVADGVSDRSQDAYLKSIGCEYFQGEYYHEMISAGEFDEKFIFRE